MNSVDEDSESDVDDCAVFCSWQPKRDYPYLVCCRESCVHGIKYIGEVGASLMQRFFWFVAVTAASLVSFYLINEGVIKPLTANPVLISFETKDITVDQIPFPAITICNGNKLKNSQLLNLSKIAGEYGEYRIKNNITNSTLINEEAALIYLFNYCATSNSFLETINSDKRIDYFLNFPKINEFDKGFENILQLVNPAFHSCEEMILLCMWEDTKVPCKELFNSVMSEFGFCCVFNMMPQHILHGYDRNYSYEFELRMSEEDISKWENWNIDCDLVELESDSLEFCKNRRKIPHNETHHRHIPQHQEKSGMTSGLTVLLDPQLDEYSGQCVNQDSEGFRVEVHSPINLPHVADFGKTISPNTETFLSIAAQITRAEDDYIVNIPTSKRKCYFEHEYSLQLFTMYTQQNCYDECLMNLTRSRCLCLLYYMPRYEDTSMCRSPADIDCTTELRKNVTTGLVTDCKKCIPSCSQIQYNADTTRFPLRDDIDMWTKFNGTDQSFPMDRKLSLVHFYYARDTVEARVRKSLYGFTEIVGNAGGLLGLMLGFSMLCVADPIYFCAIIWKAIMRKCKCSNRTRVTEIPITESKGGFSPMKFLVNPNDFMRWADPYSKDPKNRPKLIPFPRDFISGRIM